VLGTGLVVLEESALLTLSQGTIPPGITRGWFSAATSFHNRLNAGVAFLGTRQQAPGFAESVVHSVFTALGGIHVHALWLNASAGKMNHASSGNM